jgi:glutamine synthetase
MVEALALFAPSVNAFRRFSGSRAVARNRRWGYGNPSANMSFETRNDMAMIEHRVAAADACPYLVIAAVLAGVHHGISQNIEAGAPVDADPVAFVDPTFPVNIDGALLALENGSVMREYLGPTYVDLYCATKRAEVDRFREVIPLHEYDWYA